MAENTRAAKTVKPDRPAYTVRQGNRPRRYKNPEHDHQAAYFRWVRYAYPDRLVFAVPNAQVRTTVKKGDEAAQLKAMLQGKRLKAEGRVAGIPDIMVACARGGSHGLFIEMKAGRNRPSPEQLAVMAKLDGEGYRVAVCWTWDEARAATEAYMGLSVEKL